MKNLETKIQKHSLEKMSEAFDKFCSIEDDTLSEYQIWDRYFSEEWGDLDSFSKEIFSLKKSEKGSEYIKFILEKLPKDIKESINILLKKDNLSYNDIVSMLKKHKIAREYHKTILINKKCGTLGKTNHIERSKNLVLAKNISYIFSKVIKVVETENSKKIRKSLSNEKSRTYKVISP